MQGLLFAGLGFIWQNDSIEFLTIVYSFIGLAVSFSGGLGIKIANNATKGLYEWWLQQDTSAYNGPDVQGKPLKNKKDNEFPAWLYPWNFLPWVFGLTWIFIGIYWLACWEAK